MRAGATQQVVIIGHARHDARPKVYKGLLRSRLAFLDVILVAIYRLLK
jgi:hypothetical protein